MKPTPSPRALTSPRGARSPRNSSADSYLSAFLRHTKSKWFLAVFGTVAGISLLRDRPTSIDADLSFIDLPPIPFAPIPVSSYTSSTKTTRISTEQPAKGKESTKKKEKESKEGPVLSKPKTDRIKILQSYNASLHPILNTVTEVQVHFIADLSNPIAPPSKFLLDGLERSDYTQVHAITFLNPGKREVQVHRRKDDVPLIWMVDWGSMQRDCHRLERVLDGSRLPSEMVVLVDFTGSARQTQCKFWNKNVRLVKRNIVEGRHYKKKKTLDPGRLATNAGTPGGPTLHAPLIVREKMVEALWELTGNGKDPSSYKERNIDVSFLWDNGDNSHYGFFRRDVAKMVKTMHHSKYDSSSSKIIEALAQNVHNDEKGMEAGNVQIEYAQTLLSSKIVVVAQRDEWEDQYRLMESLASGALVLLDSMLAPPEGLVNNTNCIMYEGLVSLKKLIRYYLKNESKRKAIAKKGFKLALGRHRSWHRIESILFGRPLTLVDQPSNLAPERAPRPDLLTVVEGDDQLMMPVR